MIGGIRNYKIPRGLPSFDLRAILTHKKKTAKLTSANLVDEIVEERTISSETMDSASIPNDPNTESSSNDIIERLQSIEATLSNIALQSYRAPSQQDRNSRRGIPNNWDRAIAATRKPYARNYSQLDRSNQRANQSNGTNNARPSNERLDQSRSRNQGTIRPLSCFTMIDNQRNAASGTYSQYNRNTTDDFINDNTTITETTKAHESQTRNIEFRLTGVPKSLDDDVIPYLITNNFQNEVHGEIVTKSSYTSSYTSWNLKTLILSANREIATALLKKGYVYIRNTTYKCSRIVRTLQCTRCIRYGHLKSECNYDESCGHCAMQHSKKDCHKLETPQICVNCIRAGMHEEYALHSPYYMLCPVRRVNIN